MCFVPTELWHETSQWWPLFGDSSIYICQFLMRSSKISLKFKNMIFSSLAFSIRVWFMLWFGENPTEIGPLVRKMQTVVLKTVFASSDSFCLIASHANSLPNWLEVRYSATILHETEVYCEPCLGGECIVDQNSRLSVCTSVFC